ncbi:orotidine-5'-phosphate decarboxylase [Candidatus Roizmanbacteria bacterium CG_4_8_14_3_um_filter_34_9]|uniref:Orotidine-5'-phosphate decarboxylase n=1 Tax=Candidatus Roizmanbacteria bacterium CG_4_8_14_3_um_filter_34_9 TaxID=1974832 RepID=A0A2M7IBT7_9BACT|nr:MAG: orotidine-5'-phosphate decarboxylase [Candidatus Roizmanbacteria bacterium CG_4_8_14_3_um_filter_34_9]
MTFQEKLDRIVKKNKSLVCIGLDQNLLSFNKTIIEATHDLVCSYKLNTAFYEAIGHEGINALKDTCDYLVEKYPEIPIIIDAKRADIGNTNKGYVQFVFTYLGADAITVHPYLGEEAIRPFLDCKDKGVIVLCRTSNSGAGEFQDLKVSGKSLYKIVAENVSNKWNINKNCMLVVGATYPAELKEVRKIVGDMTLLVPGIGAQGGDLEATLSAGLNSKKQGLIINSSRGIIFAKNPRDEAMKLRNSINKQLNTEV